MSATENELREQLAAKEEELFDFQATLASIQAESQHRIHQVERQTQEQVRQLREQLRRVEQEANRSRSQAVQWQHKYQKHAAVRVTPQVGSPQPERAPQIVRSSPPVEDVTVPTTPAVPTVPLPQYLRLVVERETKDPLLRAMLANDGQSDLQLVIFLMQHSLAGGSEAWPWVRAALEHSGGTWVANTLYPLKVEPWRAVVKSRSNQVQSPSAPSAAPEHVDLCNRWQRWAAVVSINGQEPAAVDAMGSLACVFGNLGRSRPTSVHNELAQVVLDPFYKAFSSRTEAFLSAVHERYPKRLADRSELEEQSTEEVEAAQAPHKPSTDWLGTCLSVLNSALRISKDLAWWEAYNRSARVLVSVVDILQFYIEPDLQRYTLDLAFQCCVWVKLMLKFPDGFRLISSRFPTNHTTSSHWHRVPSAIAVCTKILHRIALYPSQDLAVARDMILSFFEELRRGQNETTLRTLIQEFPDEYESAITLLYYDDNTISERIRQLLRVHLDELRHEDEY